MAVQKFGPNHEGRDFVVGDIHGHYTILMEHLEAVNFDFEKDRLFCTGDLVDRGKENHRVLKLTRESWFHSCKGNHEEMMFAGLLSPFQDAYTMHYQNSYGKWARRETYKKWGMSYRELLQFIERLRQEIPIAMELEHANGKRYGFVHAACPDFDWNKVDSDDQFATWDRHAFMGGWPETVKNIDYVFHGHTHASTEEPVKIANRIYLDTTVYKNNVFHIWEIGNEDQLTDNLLSEIQDED